MKVQSGAAVREGKGREGGMGRHSLMNCLFVSSRPERKCRFTPVTYACFFLYI